MPDLAQFQCRFAAAITAMAPDAARPEMAVYRNSWLRGAVDALAANYPAVVAALGADRFAALAADHARRFPPSSPVLADYGARFPDEIATSLGRAAPPWLADMARIDRMRTEAHLAADAAPVAPDTDADWMTLRLRIHPATRFADFDGTALRSWSRHAGVDFTHAFTGSSALVTRPWGAVQVTALSPAGTRILAGIAGGATIGEVVIAVVSRWPGTDVTRLFTHLINQGAFAA